jgi:coenzyme F420-reducing hydrogenase alpha subunit
MVGALARININHQYLNPLARGIYKKLGWKIPEYNTFKNIVAQAIEIVHCLEEAEKLLRELVGNLKEESNPANLVLIGNANPLGQDSYGCDCVEAPRGTLYHSYKVNREGMIADCQIITPTVSFLKNLEDDLLMYLPNVKDLSEDKRAIRIRALIRAYDPCISCATH